MNKNCTEEEAKTYLTDFGHSPQRLLEFIDNVREKHIDSLTRTICTELEARLVLEGKK